MNHNPIIVTLPRNNKKVNPFIFVKKEINVNISFKLIKVVVNTIEIFVYSIMFTCVRILIISRMVKQEKREMSLVEISFFSSLRHIKFRKLLVTIRFGTKLQAIRW